MQARAPRSQALRPYVASLWVAEGVRLQRERVLPCGDMHLAIRVRGPALRLYADDLDRGGFELSDAVACGAQGRYYLKQAVPCLTVGAQLRPGAAAALFGLSAAAIAGRHVPLHRLWGVAAERLQRTLATRTTDAARLDALEDGLRAQLRPARPLHPQVAQALARLDAAAGVGAALAGANLSHRHFVALFRDATGFAPKRYARLRRFHRLLAALPPERVDWSGLAAEHGYADQSHLIRDFRDFAGMPPRAWRDRQTHPRHLRMD